MTFGEELTIVVIDKLAIGLLLLVAGFLFNRLLERFRQKREMDKENEILRNQTKLAYLQQQIEELYSPLLGLIQYARAVHSIALSKGTEYRGETRDYFVEKYFLPLNSQMANLLRTKIYLIASDIIPESFMAFLEHQAQFECLHTLWKDKNERSDKTIIVPWPSQFEQDVSDTLKQLRKNYREYIGKL